MKNWFNCFWLLFTIDAINPIFTLLSYFHDNIRVFSKISPLLIFGFFVLFHVNHKLYLSSLSRVLLVGGCIAFGLGLIFNIHKFDSKIFSQIFAIIMPIYSISFSVHYAKSVGYNVTGVMKRLFPYIIGINVFLLLAYFYFYYISGEIRYFGFQVGWPYISAYLITQGRFGMFLVGLLLVILSGKRSSLVTSIIPFLVHVIEVVKYGKIKMIIILFFVGILVFFIGLILFDQGFFRRYDDIFRFDLSDDRITFLATSGRWQEIESIFDHMNTNKLSWFIGNGFGVKYLWVIDVPGFEYYQELKNYSHFQPLSYVFIFGVPITILIYFIIFRLVYLGWRVFPLNFFYLSFLIVLIGSFFGANFLVDPKGCFFIGVVSEFIRSTRVKYDSNI